jgi:hypothetical protein
MRQSECRNAPILKSPDECPDWQSAIIQWSPAASERELEPDLQLPLFVPSRGGQLID